MKVISKLKREPGLWLSEEEKPEPGMCDVLIKIKKTGVCGTDLHIYNWDEWSQKTIPVPMRIGHEFYGVVEAVGKEVKGFKVGDRVSGEGHLFCGFCRNCRAGKRHLCRKIMGIGCQCPGVFAEYFVMPESNVFRLPDSVTDDQASILDPYGNAVHATLEYDLVGEDVLITGAGPIGLMSVAIARHVGARHIVITDVNDYRLEVARKMGASVAVNTKNTSLVDVMHQLKMIEGFDVGLEMSGNSQAFQAMLDVMNYSGKIAMLGIPAKEFAVDWSKIIFHGLEVRGIYGRRMFETWYKGIAMLQSGLDISPVITGHYHFSEFQKAFDQMLSGKSGKIILEW